MKILLAITVAATFVVSSIQAAPIHIENHSFESPITADGTFITSDSSAPEGWSIFGPTDPARHFGVLNPNSTTLYSDSVPDGFNVGVVFLMDSSGEGGLQQVLSSTLQLNTTYTLTVEVGNIANDPNPPHNAFDFDGFPGYRIELLAGAAVIAFDDDTLTIAEGAFETSSILFSTGEVHANAGQALSIRLINLNGPGIEVNFDNVRLDAVAVPEPATWGLLLGASTVIMALTHRRKRKGEKERHHLDVGQQEP